MSIENAALEKREEQKAALDLLNENPLLANDEFAKKVVYDGGVMENGDEIDLGDFLESRLSILEKEQVEGKVAAAKAKNPQAFKWASTTIVHSVRPDLEKNLEN